MIDHRVRRVMTHEQVWQVREAHKTGMLNIAATARQLGVTPRTIRNRLTETEFYPIFETLEHARIRDQFQSSYCNDTAD